MVTDTVERATGGKERRRLQGPEQDGSGQGGAQPVSARSRRSLDAFVFFVADVQTGFGPFVAVYLTTQKWTQVDIGLVLTISGLVSLVGQIPMGALVDRIRSLRTAAAISLIVIGLSAVAFALWPIFPVVLVSRIFHAGASLVLGLALVSLSLALVGERGISERLGRNAAFASAGTGIAAAVMGATGYYLSNHAVFLLAAALTVPAIAAVMRIRAEEIDLSMIRRRTPEPGERARRGAGLIDLARNRPLLIFAACVVMFHLANAAMLPLAASMLTLRSSQSATIVVAAAMVVPQFTVTVLSPFVGHYAARWGRRPLLIIGFAALAMRGALFALVEDPQLLVLIQILDGASAAALGVLVPLTVADLTRSSGHFNLAQGAVGCAMGIGASISTTLAGYVSDEFGSYSAFATLAVLAAAGLALVVLAMPETRTISAKVE